MKQKELSLVLFFLIACVSTGRGQLSGGDFALKTNLLELGSTTLNLGAEFRLSKRYSVNLSGSLNPWTFSGNKKFQHWTIRPEGRYWLSETFQGHFFGIHAFHGRFNAGGIAILGLKHERREGHFTGGGFSYGYMWRLSDTWRLETTFGLGYAYQDYKRFDCPKCGELRGKDHKNYIGPTQAGISLVYGF